MAKFEFENELDALLRSINTREISGLRNRVLIQISAATGIDLKLLCQLRVWQLTYWHSHVPSHDMKPYRNYRQCPAPSGIPLGLYENDQFKSIIPLQLANRHSIRRYIQALGADAFGDAFLFPRINKGGNVDLQSAISSIRAEKILAEIKSKMPTACKLTWPEIKQISIVRLLLQGEPKEHIIHNTAYKDHEYIAKIGSAMGIQTHSNARFVPDCKIGYDYQGSFLSKNMKWYLNRINQQQYQNCGPL